MAVNKVEQTLSIVKPDGVERGLLGKIITHYEEQGLRLVAAKFKQLARSEAAGFYHVHRERPFFEELVAYMLSSPVFISVLQGENAIHRQRDLMGVTDPSKAAQGTIRALYGQDIGKNTVHGSDGVETARFEVGFFFPQMEIYPHV